MIKPTECSIGDLMKQGTVNLQTGPFGTQLKASEYIDEGIPVINVRNIGFGGIRDSDLEYISNAKAEKLYQHRLELGDIVFGRKGAVERHALISDAQVGWIQGSDCLRLRMSDENMFSAYLSYYLRTKAHQDWMQALCSFGATMSSLNQDIVSRIRFPSPSLELQTKIAAILSAYDDLIENNRRRIALLEKMAEELYREWFVRLRFPGYKDVEVVKGVPEGWSLGKASNFFDVVKGKSYAADELVKMLAFAGHGTKLLSKETVRDLDVWTQGVAATADLRSLELDVNDPASIKKTLQPLLLKQYR